MCLSRKMTWMHIQYTLAALQVSDGKIIGPQISVTVGRINEIV